MACGHRPDWPSSFEAIVSALRAKRAVGAEHARRQPLEQHRVVGGNAEMAQAALGVGHRQREGARRRRSASWYFRASASTVSRSGAMPVAKQSRTVAPGGSRIR